MIARLVGIVVFQVADGILNRALDDLTHLQKACLNVIELLEETSAFGYSPPQDRRTPHARVQPQAAAVELYSAKPESPIETTSRDEQQTLTARRVDVGHAVDDHVRSYGNFGSISRPVTPVARDMSSDLLPSLRQRPYPFCRLS